MKEYILSAKAILYIAKVAGAETFVGLPNVYGDFSENEIKKVDSEASEELMAVGLITMDFDGKSVIDEELKNAVKTCSNVAQVMGIDLKNKDESISKLTVFVAYNDDRYLMTTFGQEKDKYLFTKKSNEEIIQFIKENIALPSGEEGSETVLETALITEPKLEKLIEAGCDNETAKLIDKGINGGEMALTSRRVIYRVEDECFVYIWNSEKILRMTVSYEDDKELMHFIPVAKENIFENLAKLLEKPVYSEDDDEEGDYIASPEEEEE